MDEKQKLDAISRRLFGTLDLNDQTAIRSYVQQHARSCEDIASYHARMLALTIAKRRSVQAGHVDAFVSQLKKTREVPAAALQLLLDAFSEHAQKLCEQAWSEDKPKSLWVGRGSEPSSRVDRPDDGAAALGTNELPTREIEAVEESSMLRPDAKLVAYLESIGPNGKAIAEGIRDKARSLWAEHKKTGGTKVWQRWLDPDSEDMMFPRWAKALLQVLWLDVVTPQLERAAIKPASLVMAIAEPVTHLFSRVHREEERNGQRVLPLPGDVIVRVAKDAAAIGADTLNAIMVDRGIKLLGSVAAHRVLRWQIFTAHRQALEENPDPRVIRVDGGWSVLANDVLKMEGKKAPDQVRDIIEAMHATELPLPPQGVYSRLLIRTVYPAVGRRQGRIELVLGTALLPDYVHSLKRLMGTSHDARRALRLVPVLELPPFVGRNNEHGAQATFSMLLVAHLRDHARELVQEGGVRIDDPTLVRLADAAGLPRSSVAPVMDRWFHDGDDGPALLKRAGDRITLGDAHQVALKFIEQGGQLELDGAEAGKKGVARRRAKLKQAATGTRK